MNTDADTVILEDTSTTTRLAPLYKVLLHNDDITPVEVVIAILARIFYKNAKDAIGIMLTAHNEGIALVEILPLEQAEFKVEQAHSISHGHQYPLTFSIEEA